MRIHSLRKSHIEVDTPRIIHVPYVTQYVVLPGWNSDFRAGFWPDCYREGLKIGPPAGRRADFEAFPIRLRPKSGPLPAGKRYCVT